MFDRKAFLDYLNRRATARRGWYSSDMLARRAINAVCGDKVAWARACRETLRSAHVAFLEHEVRR